MQRRFAAILLILVSLASVGHLSYMAAMAADHAAHGHMADMPTVSCPMGFICLAAVGNIADMPASFAWLIVFAVIISAAGFFPTLFAQPRPRSPVHIRTGTGFPELLSIFKRE